MPNRIKYFLTRHETANLPRQVVLECFDLHNEMRTTTKDKKKENGGTDAKLTSATKTGTNVLEILGGYLQIEKCDVCTCANTTFTIFS